MITSFVYLSVVTALEYIAAVFFNRFIINFDSQARSLRNIHIAVFQCEILLEHFFADGSVPDAVFQQIRVGLRCNEMERSGNDDSAAPCMGNNGSIMGQCHGPYPFGLRQAARIL